MACAVPPCHAPQASPKWPGASSGDGHRLERNKAASGQRSPGAARRACEFDFWPRSASASGPLGQSGVALRRQRRPGQALAGAQPPMPPQPPICKGRCNSVCGALPPHRGPDPRWSPAHPQDGGRGTALCIVGGRLPCPDKRLQRCPEAHAVRARSCDRLSSSLSHIRFSVACPGFGGRGPRPCPGLAAPEGLCMLPEPCGRARPGVAGPG